MTLEHLTGLMIARGEVKNPYIFNQWGWLVRKDGKIMPGSSANYPNYNHITGEYECDAGSLL